MLPSGNTDLAATRRSAPPICHVAAAGNLDPAAAFMRWGVAMQIQMKSIFIALAFAAGLLTVPAAAEPTPPQAVVQRFYDTLLSVMKDSKELGFPGRYQKLKPAIESAYNLPLMSRLSVGPQWQSLNPQQQQAFAAAFGEFTVATYANRFDDYSVTLNYLMRESDGAWQIIDVFLSGTISELATRRSEFTSILRRDGPDGLLQVLGKRVAELKAS